MMFQKNNPLNDKPVQSRFRFTKFVFIGAELQKSPYSMYL